jgi:alkylation response protein AidB-like acyl-CoA dehydrogenase
LGPYFADLAASTSIDGPRPDYVRAIKQMDDDGWLGISQPTDYGGHGRGPVDQMIFVEESHWAGVPLSCSH